MQLTDLKKPYIAVVVLSIVAIFPMPYGFYTFLRIIITIVAAITAYQRFKHKDKGWITWTCAGIAILFNPILPVYFPRSVWFFINLFVAVFFAILYYTLPRPTYGQTTMTSTSEDSKNT